VYLRSKRYYDYYQHSLQQQAATEVRESADELINSILPAITVVYLSAPLLS
jgi:hypothetical protein